jgi:simple sugar transport system ATP-binding protein
LLVCTARLLETMLELKKHGVAQIIISHRLQDILAVGDRVMVLKRGENVGERVIKKTTEQEVLQIIVSGVRAANGEGRSAPVVKAKGKAAAKRGKKK